MGMTDIMALTIINSIVNIIVLTIIMLKVLNIESIIINAIDDFVRKVEKQEDHKRKLIEELKEQEKTTDKAED